MVEKTKDYSAAVSKAESTKKELDKKYFNRGLNIGIQSGIYYGLYTALVTTATVYGIWKFWYSGKAGLSYITLSFILGTLATGINDLTSAIWALANSIFKGKFGDFIKTLKTKPGMIMVFAAIVGGPIAGVTYILAVQMGGPVVIPIAGLNVAIGAILGRVILKQELSARTILGIVICLASSLLIGATSLTGEVKDGMILGIILAIIAAFGWGLEGVIAGFGTSMIDSEIGIAIRQTTSSLANLFIVLPIFGLIEGSGIHLISSLFIKAFTDPTILILFASGFFTFISFAFWYKGTSMCGAALGMACNGTYTFWGPFFCWIILGIILKNPGYEIAPIAWFGSLLMALGIFIMSVNPLDYLKRGNK